LPILQQDLKTKGAIESEWLAIIQVSSTHTFIRELFEPSHSYENYSRIISNSRSLLSTCRAAPRGFSVSEGGVYRGCNPCQIKAIEEAKALETVTEAVTSSGISALLLKCGCTAHSRFKIPINPDAATILPIPKASALSGLLRQLGFFCAEAVDRALQDIRNDQRPFGGITSIFGGDWAQSLPEVVGGVLLQMLSLPEFKVPPSGQT
jgi:hypothetical protein